MQHIKSLMANLDSEIICTVKNNMSELRKFVNVPDEGEFTLNAPITTKVVCFSRLLKCLRSLFDKQCGPRSDCSYRSSLIWVQAVCFYF